MRLLYVIIFFGVVFIGFITYLRTPVPQVNLPTDLQPPFPQPLPHTFNNLPYANTEWPSVHGGPANNDYVAINHGVEFAWEWQALVGMATIVAPTTGPGGNLYQTAGNPPGGSNLFALNRKGEILWQTPAWHNKDDFDSCAALNAPIVDTAGDIYVSDCNQFWAFKPDGQVKWVINLPTPGPGSAFQDVDEDVEVFNPENPSQKITVKRLTEMWSLDLGWLLERELPVSLELLLGERFIMGGGTISVTDTGLIMPVVLGYNLSIAGRTLPLVVKIFYLNVHPETGTLLAGSIPYEAQDSNDAWVVPLEGGQLVFNNGSMRSSMSALFAPLVNPLLSLHGLHLLTPKGGIESIRAVRYAVPGQYSE